MRPSKRRHRVHSDVELKLIPVMSLLVVLVPMLLLQIVVNLFLDWLLIVHFRLGAWGGVGAVLGTFLLTVPVRVWYVGRIIGGIHFPIRFFLRVLSTLVFAGGLLFWQSEETHPRLNPALEGENA